MVPTPDGLTELPAREFVYQFDKRYKLKADLILIDTLKEREIEAGVAYKFDPMTQGQCLINKYHAAQLKIEQGDVFYAKIVMEQNLIALIDQYNKMIAVPQNKTKILRDAVTG